MKMKSIVCVLILTIICAGAAHFHYSKIREAEQLKAQEAHDEMLKKIGEFLAHGHAARNASDQLDQTFRETHELFQELEPSPFSFQGETTEPYTGYGETYHL